MTAGALAQLLEIPGLSRDGALLPPDAPLRSGDRLRCVADYAEFFRYRHRGVFVVAGYHYWTDSRFTAFDYRGFDFGTHGVDHAGESYIGKLAL